MKTILILFTGFLALSLSAVAGQLDENNKAQVRWTENDQTVTVTAKEILQSKEPVFGYLKDFSTKKEVCYSGQAAEAVDLIYAGLNHKGEEHCDKYVIEKPDGTIEYGPCWMGETMNDLYTQEFPICK